MDSEFKEIEALEKLWKEQVTIQRVLGSILETTELDANSRPADIRELRTLRDLAWLLFHGLNSRWLALETQRLLKQEEESK